MLVARRSCYEELAVNRSALNRIASLSLKDQLLAE